MLLTANLLFFSELHTISPFQGYSTVPKNCQMLSKIFLKMTSPDTNKGLLEGLTKLTSIKPPSGRVYKLSRSNTLNTCVHLYELCHIPQRNILTTALQSKQFITTPQGEMKKLVFKTGGLYKKGL